MMTQILIDGKIITNKTQISLNLTKYYENLFTEKQHTGKKLEDFDQLKIFHNLISSENKIKIGSCIKMHELDAGMGTLNKDSTPGIDGVSQALLQRIYETKPKILLDYLNYIKTNGSEKAFIISYKVLRKPGKKDYSLPENYRPIALMAMATRLLDKILLNRVSKILEEIKIPSFEHNIAYKKNYHHKIF